MNIFEQEKAKLTAEKADLEKKLEGETNLNISSNVNHNLKVCEKELELLERQEKINSKREQLKELRVEHRDDKALLATIDQEVINLEAEQKQLDEYKATMADKLKRVDLEAIYQVFSGKSM